jgi:hypothetical protein
VQTIQKIKKKRIISFSTKSRGRHSSYRWPQDSCVAVANLLRGQPCYCRDEQRIERQDLIHVTSLRPSRPCLPPPPSRHLRRLRESNRSPRL